MKKFDVNVLFKNLSGILCGAMVLCFLLPFVSVGVEVNAMGASGSDTEVANGIQVLTDGGFTGILLLICPILILVANYLPQLGQYKKILSLVFSAVSVVDLFIVPGQIVAATSGGEGSTIDVKVTYMIGFWLMLIFAVALIGLSTVQFFNLKGNKIFDAVNSSNDTEVGEGVSMPQLKFDKINDIAKNVSNTVSQQVSNISSKVENTVSNANIPQIEKNTQTIANENCAPQAPKTSSAVNHKKTVNTVPKENPEEIMNLIKKLYDMKEDGVLTDEEFTEKKKEMLQKM